MPDKLLNEAAVAKRLNVSERTLRRYRKMGIIPYVRVNRMIRYRESDVERFISNGISGETKWVIPGGVRVF